MTTINAHTEHRKLNEGDLVRTATGELCRAQKHPSDPGRTSLERWSDEYGIVLRDKSWDSDGYEADPFPLTVVQLAAPGGVPLSEDERSYLAMHARYESGRQEDFRYWHEDPAERERLRLRWLEIADWLHPQPWATAPTDEPAT